MTDTQPTMRAWLAHWRATLSRRRWPRYFRFYRRMGFARLSAAWHAVRFANTRPQVYRRGPPR